MHDIAKRYFLLKSVCFCNILPMYRKRAIFCGCFCCVLLLLLFPPFSPHHVNMTVLITLTITGTIRMTNKQIIQKCFNYLSFYADVFSYACSESSASTSPALFSFVKTSASNGRIGASLTTGLL